MRRTAYLLILTFVLIITLAATMVIATTSTPAAICGPTDMTSTTIRGAPATSLLQGATTMAMTFPMVPSTIRSTHYVITDAKLTFGFSPPALLESTDIVTTMTRSDYFYTANLADQLRMKRLRAAPSMNVLGVSFTF